MLCALHDDLARSLIDSLNGQFDRATARVVESVQAIATKSHHSTPSATPTRISGLKSPPCSYASARKGEAAPAERELSVEGRDVGHGLGLRRVRRRGGLDVLSAWRCNAPMGRLGVRVGSHVWGVGCGRAGEGSGDLGLMCVFTLNTCCIHVYSV